jgi:hypothetical protein
VIAFRPPPGQGSFLPPRKPCRGGSRAMNYGPPWHGLRLSIWPNTFTQSVMPAPGEPKTNLSGRAALICTAVFWLMICWMLISGPMSSEAPVEVVLLFPVVGLLHIFAIVGLIAGGRKNRIWATAALLLFWVGPLIVAISESKLLN